MPNRQQAGKRPTKGKPQRGWVAVSRIDGETLYAGNSQVPSSRNNDSGTPEAYWATRLANCVDGQPGVLEVKWEGPTWTSVVKALMSVSDSIVKRSVPQVVVKAVDIAKKVPEEWVPVAGLPSGFVVKVLARSSADGVRFPDWWGSRSVTEEDSIQQRQWTERITQKLNNLSQDQPTAASGLPQEVSASLPDQSEVPASFSFVERVVTACRMQLIEDLEPLFREILQEHPPRDLASRRATVYFLNKVLRENALGIAFPESQEASSLLVVTSPTMKDGRIVLQSRKLNETGSYRKSPPIDRKDAETQHFQPLRLIVYPRQESLSREARKRAL